MMLAEAIALARLGWAVVPLKPQSKVPLVSWKELQTRKLPESEIVEIFEQNPDLNIGVVTGTVSQLMVLDADAPSVVKKLGVPETPVAETARGRHYYFQLPDAKIRSVTGLSDGLDIKAAGGYVVSPPSVHPTGIQYLWVIPPKGIDYWGAEPAPPPAWLMEMLSRRRAQPKALEISQIVGGVKEGKRNDAAARYAGYLLAKTPEDLWESDVWPTLRHWNKSNKPPLPERELRQVFKKIAAREHQRRLTGEPKELRLTRALQKLGQHFKLSQRQLSQLTQIPQQTLSRWFVEATKSPSRLPLWGNGSFLSEKCRFEAESYVESDSR